MFNAIATILNLYTRSWDSWWFPGLSELLDMLAFAFWWELVFVVAAIPVIIVVFIFSAIVSSS